MKTHKLDFPLSLPAPYARPKGDFWTEGLPFYRSDRYMLDRLRLELGGLARTTDPWLNTGAGTGGRALLFYHDDQDHLGSGVIGGVQYTMKLHELPERPGGLIGVDMNQAREVYLSDDNIGGGIGTNNLAGCTGIAGVAELPGGQSYAYVSHYDQIADRLNRIHAGGFGQVGDAPSTAALVGFLAETKRRGGQNVRVVVAYLETTVHASEYGKRNTEHGKWFYLDQIELALQVFGSEAATTVVPYQLSGGHSLVCVKTSDGMQIEFDGQPVTQ